MMKVVVTGAIRHAKLQSNQIITNQPTTNFLQAGRPTYRQTNSITALKGRNITFHGYADPKLTWEFSNPISDH